MLVVLTVTYCNKVNIQITQRDGFIQIAYVLFMLEPHVHSSEYVIRELICGLPRNYGTVCTK